MATLQTDVRTIKGIGESRAKALEKLNIRSISSSPISPAAMRIAAVSIPWRSFLWVKPPAAAP